MDNNNTRGMEDIDDDLLRTHLIIIWAINTVGSVVGTVGNVFVLAVFAMFRRLRTHTNKLILSLIVSDLLASLILQPVRADFYNPLFEVGIKRVSIMYIFSVLSYFSSMLNILAVSLERFYAIYSPLRYPSVVTPRFTNLVLLFVWVVSIVIALSLYNVQEESQFTRGIFNILAISTFSVVLMCLVCIYGYIFYVVRTQKKNLAQITLSGGDDMEQRQVFDKSTLIASLFVCSYVMLWLPVWLYIIATETFLAHRNNSIKSRLIMEYLSSLHLWNGSINWYIYCWKCKEFKKCVKQWTRRCCRTAGTENIDFV